MLFIDPNSYNVLIADRRRELEHQAHWTRTTRPEHRRRRKRSTA
jgi:hypothetical protein